jgi:hypothetical protein
LQGGATGPVYNGASSHHYVICAVVAPQVLQAPKLVLVTSSGGATPTERIISPTDSCVIASGTSILLRYDQPVRNWPLMYGTYRLLD